MTNWDTKIETSANSQPEPNVQKRWNPNIPYAPQPEVTFVGSDLVLFKAIDTAIQNGWQGWKLMLNDTVTRGLEAEGLLKQIKKYQKPLETLVYNKEFNYFLWIRNTAKGNWRYHLQQMVIADNVVKYLEENM